MKHLVSLLILLTACSIGSAQGFNVDQYRVQIFLSEDGYFDVIEDYDLDFYEEKHGIFRDIITDYQFQDENGKVKKVSIEITNIDVPDHKFSAPSKFNQRIFGGDTSIKIGDAKKTVTGRQHYQIKYRVEKAIIFNDNQAQLYWNAKPADWIANFKNVSFTVHAPDGAVLTSENCFVYSGSFGVTKTSKDFTYDYAGNKFSGVSNEGFQSPRGSNVTLLIKLPAEMIKDMNDIPWWQKYGWAVILLSLLPFFKGRKKPIAVTSYFPPENIGPAMAGYLIDDSADNRDLISLLPLWARQGSLKMKEVKEEGTSSDVELIKLKSLPEDAETYEHIIFDGLFPPGTNSIKTSDLAEKFYVTMGSAKNDLVSKSKKYYDEKKTGTANKKGCVISALAIPVALLFWYFWGGWVGAIAGGVVFAIAVMGESQVKNAKGSLIQSELLGFQNFIKLSDVKRIETLLKDDPDYYEKTMPYAVAFDLLGPWTKNFDELGVQPPEWYEPAAGGGFTSLPSFSDSLTKGLSSARNNFVSAPEISGGSSSSGGGSSGGGFGGGGGGSW